MTNASGRANRDGNPGPSPVSLSGNSATQPNRSAHSQSHPQLHSESRSQPLAQTHSPSHPESKSSLSVPSSRPRPSRTRTKFRYPLAPAPDIIRSHQKDAYFSTVLSSSLADTLRHVLGARVAHTWAAETKTAAELVYYTLTTLVGNRTLGEEYCDLVPVDGRTGALPGFGTRAGVVAAGVVGPYVLGVVVPRVRERLRALLSRGLEPSQSFQNSEKRAQEAQPGRTGRKGSSSSSILVLLALFARKVQRYVLDNLDTITSPGPISAASLAVFYFSGAYYHIGKRLFGVRYALTRMLDPDSGSRAGYEVLGVLLVLQLVVQAWFHVKETLASAGDRSRGVDVLDDSAAGIMSGTAGTGHRPELVSLNPLAYATNNALLHPTDGTGIPGPGSGSSFPNTAGTSSTATTSIERLTGTPSTAGPAGPRIDLGARSGPGARTMGWIRSRTDRTCTLCLDGMKDPAVATCGHVFCWTCILDWCREKAECPLCRQVCLAQHVLVLRG